MLSPVVHDTRELITRVFNEVIALDKYSIGNNNIVIGKLPNDPEWLIAVRKHVESLGTIGARWIQKKAEVWSSILGLFPSYTSAIESLAEIQKTQGIQKDQWPDLLEELLLTQLNKAVQVSEDAEKVFKSEFNDLRGMQPSLEKDIEAGWEALAEEEESMIKIAQELTKLQDTVSSLEDEITSADISAGKSVFQTTVTLMYKVVTSAEMSFSFLSMASSAFTVSKFFYDVISDTDKIDQALEEIAKYQTEASEEAQALAGTKSVIQLVYKLEESFLSIQDVVPQLTKMWESERDKVKIVIDGLKAGADPSKYFQLETLSTSSENWKEINDFTLNIPKMIQISDKSVELDPSKITQKA